MTIKTLLKVNNISYTDSTNINLNKSRGQNNSTSRLTSDHNNCIGIHARNYEEGRNIGRDIVGLWHFDKDANDETSSINNGSIVGAKFDFDAIKGNSIRFDGINDVVNLSEALFEASGNTNHTLSIWVKTNTSSDFFYQQAGDGGNDRLLLDINSGHARWWRPTGNIEGSINIADGNWHNIIFTRNGVNNSVAIYIDGILDISAVDSESTFDNNAPELGHAFTYYNGKIDEVNFWNRVLLSTEITELQSTPVKLDDFREGLSADFWAGRIPTNKLVSYYKMEDDTGIAPSNCLIGYYPFSGNSDDSSGNENNGTIVNATLTTDKNGISDKAYDFNGSSAYIETPITQSEISGTVTYSCWIKPDALDSGQRFLSLTTGNETAGEFFVRINDASGFLRFYRWSGSGTTLEFWTTTILKVSTSAWHNVVITFDGSNATFYVDGVSESPAKSSASSGIGAQPITTMIIGAYQPSAFIYYDGKIDEVRVYDRVLNTKEIDNLYVNYDFEVPQVIKDELGNNNGTNNGSIQVTGKLNEGLSFDGSISKLEMTNPMFESTGNTDHSFSIWLKTNTSSDFFYQQAGDGGNDRLLLDVNSTFARWWRPTGNIQGSINIADGNWHNIIFTRLATSKLVSIYVDGVLDNSGTDSESTFDNNAPELGHAFTYYNGDMDEFSFYDKILTLAEIAEIYNAGEGATINKLFTGTIIEQKFIGSGKNKEKVNFTARDLTNKLQKITVPPEVYTNKEISFIQTDLMQKYGPSGITINNINFTNKTLSRFQIKQKNLYDALAQLASFVDFIIYVDEDSDFHSEAKGTKSSDVILNSNNTTQADFKLNIEDVYNEIYVYGDRQQVKSPTESFTADGTSSVFSLKYGPFNTSITAGGVDQVGVLFDNNIVPESGADYGVNFHDKQVVFFSGTDLGYSSIPSSGTIITADYQVSRPIIKFAEDTNSQTLYGKRSEVIEDTEIQDPNMAKEIVQNRLALKKDPKKEGTASVEGVYNLIPGQTVIVNQPFHGVNEQVFDIIRSNYTFNSNNNLSEQVLKVTFSERIVNLTDVLKELILQVKRLEADKIDTSGVVSRIQAFTGSMGLSMPFWSVSKRRINDSFILGHPNNGELGLMDPNNVGSIIGVPDWVSGNTGFGYDKAISFTGSPNHIAIDNVPVVNYPFSMACWSYFTSGNNSKWFMSLTDKSETSVYFSLRFDGTGSVGVIARNTTSYQVRASGAPDQWHHMAAVFESSSNRSFYHNGSFIGSVNGTANFPVGADTIYINRQRGTDANSICSGCRVDDARFYNKSLSTSEVGSLFNKVNYPTGSMVGYWTLDEGSGNLAYSSVTGTDYHVQPLLGDRRSSPIIEISGTG